MLIKVALCEDNILDQKATQKYLSDWAERNGHRIEVRIFPDTDKLLGFTDDAFEVFDVYILDIEMKTPQEGLDFAKKMRKQYEDIPIIFITSHSELAFDSYNVRALHFLGKPINQNYLFSTLERLVKSLEKRKTSFFPCTIDGVLMKFSMHEIRYLATDNHYLLINGDITRRFRGKLSEIIKMYPDKFVLCHQSYAVNIEHIRSLAANSLLLDDATELPISKNNLDKVRQRFVEVFGIAPMEN